MKQSFLVITLFLVLLCSASPAVAEMPTGFFPPSENTVMPCYTLTDSIAVTLTFSGGVAQCSSRLVPLEDDTVSLILTLYKQNGTDWEYVDSWSGSATGGRAVSIRESIAVSRGTYMLTANGNVANQEFPSVSQVKTY